MLSLTQLWHKIRPDNLLFVYWRISLAVVLLLLESVASVVTPLLFSRMVGTLSAQRLLLAVPVWLILQYAIVRTVSALATAGREILVVPVETDLQRRVAVAGLEHVHKMSVRFHLNRQTGALTRILDRGADAVGTVLSLVLFNVIPNVLQLSMTFVVILRVFDWRYVAILIVAIMIYATTSYYFTKMRMAARRARNLVNTQAQHQLVDSILNFETVRSFANISREIHLYDEKKKQWASAEIYLQRLVNISQMCRSLLIVITTTVLLSLAAFDIVHHKIAVAQFVLIGSYLSSLYSSVAALNYVGAGWRNARVDLENYLELLATNSEILDSENAISLPFKLKDGEAATIKFDHVGFAYDEKRTILQDISFEVPAGTTLAIVGHTGSGKSTLGRLLTRAYDPTSGAIFIDGYNLKNIAQENLHKIIGIVPQDTVLFNAEIGKNIAYGDLSASFEDIENAAKKAQIDAFIQKIPEKYDTIVGERGLKLSGGEKQRVAIARVLLKDPRILLLDEATSALDTQTESAIQNELSVLSRLRTTVIIAHRLSTIQDADQIIVLHEGKIIERGTHIDLLKKNGYYAAMWLAQAGDLLTGT
ncbi:ABCB family ABC transporter ATP-binding protein/permease [Swingsia samuiensis]|nr:ATP-binding cassette domain-containing protein [Swingsia samuiensis]